MQKQRFLLYEIMNSPYCLSQSELGLFMTPESIPADLYTHTRTFYSSRIPRAFPELIKEWCGKKKSNGTINKLPTSKENWKK